VSIASTAAHAVPTVYQTPLSGANEAPPNASTAFGNATVIYDSALHSIEVVLSFSGLSTPASAGHIHCCTAPGTNVGVALPFAGLPNATSGSYDQLFDLTLTSSYTDAFITASGGTTATAESALAAGIASGLAYVNLHNSVFPGGEIRGFLAPAVPEPASLALMLVGLGVVGLYAGRRRS
jgi:CHRD domain/PEP-CTERM motif